VTLSYQDYLGNPMSTDVSSNVIIDTTAPVISKLEHSIMRPAGLSVRWVTNEPATTRVLYSKTAPGSLTDTTTDMTLTTVHVSSTLGLDELTEYSFYVTSTDAAGNSSISDDIVLNTANQGGGEGVPSIVTVEIIPDNSDIKKVDEKWDTSDLKNTSYDFLNVPKDIDTILNSADETECNISPYLTNAIKLGKKNNPEDVKLLEAFLNKYENANLPVDGIYSREDFDAVIKWQEKHADDVLKPWGLKKGTGYVFKTSLAKIKEIEESACDKEEKK
jgi:hypothetical protein